MKRLTDLFMALLFAAMLSIAQKLREKNENAVIAFVSGVVLPEPEHFRVQPYRYLLKSADIDERMRDIGELLLETKRRSRREVAEVVSDGEARRVPVGSILYIEKTKRGSRLTVEAGAAGAGRRCRATSGWRIGMRSFARRDLSTRIPVTS